MIYFDCDGLRMSAIWHCFGNYMHRVDLVEVLAMLDASGTNVVPVNTHELDMRMRPEDLRIGFGDVSYGTLAQAKDLSGFVLMANINHQTSADAAVQKTLLAVEMTGIETIKLEVLSENLSDSNDVGLVDAVTQLRKQRPGLRIMPLLSNDAIVAQELRDAGCPLLRVMGSPIGSGGGIADEAAFERCCHLDVPIVLDGGIGNVEDYAAARRLGAAGCLVNSMLFERGAPPSTVLRDFVERALHETAPV